MRTSIRSAVVIAVSTAATATAITTASPSEASPNARTFLYWRGAPCIAVESANMYAPTTSVVSTVCGGSWSFSEGNIWPGDLFGANPIMGGASYIECGVFRAGVLVYYDSAVAGDGTEVSCLRREI